MVTSNSVFISYRRDLGFAWARLVWENLNDHGIDAFLDLESLREAGHFDTKVLHQIEGRPYFVPVLVHGSLERCTQPTDWLRREIEHAVETERAIVPLVGPHFDFAEIDRCLPDPAASVLRSSNGIGLVAEYFGEAMTRLRDERLQPIDLPVRALSPADQQFAADAHQRASRTGGPEPGASTETDATTAEDRPIARMPPPVAPAAGSDRPPKRTAMGRARAVVAVAAGAAVLGVGAFATAAVLSSGETDSGEADANAARSEPTNTNPLVASPTSRPSTDPPVRSGLEPGETLRAGGANSVLRSSEGNHELELTAEGQLVLSTDGVEQLRVPGVAPDPIVDDEESFVAIMQSEDGNFVVYRVRAGDRAPPTPVWASTPRGVGAGLTLVDEAGVGRFRVEGGGQEPWTCPGDCDADAAAAQGGPATSSAATTSEPSSASTTEIPLVEVAEVIGLVVDEAALRLSSDGFEVTVTQRADDRPEGVVIDQDPTGGASRPRGSVVTIDVSLGSGFDPLGSLSSDPRVADR